MVPASSSGFGRAGLPLAPTGCRRPAVDLALTRTSDESGTATDAGRIGIPVRLRRESHLPLSLAEPLQVLLEWKYDDGGIPTRRVYFRAVRWQLELARADLVSGELPHHRVPAKVPSLLRGRL